MVPPARTVSADADPELARGIDVVVVSVGESLVVLTSLVVGDDVATVSVATVSVATRSGSLSLRGQAIAAIPATTTTNDAARASQRRSRPLYAMGWSRRL